MRVSSFTAAWRSQGTLGSLAVARDMLFGTKSSLASGVSTFVTNAKVIEVGGPSRCFRRRGFIPIYPLVSSMDIVNFASSTLWEGSLEDGATFAPEGRVLGHQLLREATDLEGIADHSYDVVISSHCLEHSANALHALREWKRVCKPDGYLCLVLPHRDGTFDWMRPVTEIEHYLRDEADNVGEDDQTHFEEIVEFHDISRDSGVRSRDALRQRVSQNFHTRAVHHHVFDLRSACLLVAESGWSPQASEARRPYDIVVLARNCVSNARLDLTSVMGSSPFRTDHH